MRTCQLVLILIIFPTFFLSCSRDMDMILVDANATTETRNLYKNLVNLAPEAVLFGHQNALAYGVYWRDDPNRSDVKDVTGSYPAVYGWDANVILPTIRPDRPGYDVQSERLRNWILEGYNRGGVITMSWHMWNPVTGGNFYDTTPGVHAILPGGDRHEYYRSQLDTLALLFGGLHAEPEGELIPVIFRPFHEHNGDWFWWCKAFTTEGGLEAIPDPTFWTETLLAGILANEITREISWVLIWSNANRETDRENHYYAPYPGQVSVADFIRFKEHPFVLFEDDLPHVYNR
jgi:hypothetical protein